MALSKPSDWMALHAVYIRFPQLVIPLSGAESGQSAGHFLPHFGHSARASSLNDTDALHSSGSLPNEGTQAVPLDLPPKHLYTCTVGRNRSQAR